MKKSILKLSSETEHENRQMFSISTGEKDIRICWILNQVLKANLFLVDDIIVSIKQSDVVFRNYYFESDEGIDKYHLFVNRGNGAFLFPELKNVDYLLLIRSESVIPPTEDFIFQLKSFPEISAFLPVDIRKLKSFSRLKL
ncbi:MAG: IPExxxVDY family protein [Bacteroidales bacterium]|nr:IPExxxVDY family protein [Bacteroidales bacterium]